LRLAHRQWTEDREQTKRYDAMYRDLFPRPSLRERKFINFGPGSFYHKLWQTADRYYGGRTWSEQRNKGYEMRIDIEWNLIANTRVPVPDETIEIAYCSHLVEHGWDENVAFFFREVHRILKRGGVFRVTCPNAALAVRAWRRKDRHYYLKQAGRPIGYMLLGDTSLVTHPENSTRIKPDDAEGFLTQHADVFDALDEASRLSDRVLQDRIGAHVNWFTPQKLSRFLSGAGFDRVYVNGYAQSIAPVLRDTRYFDRTDPHMTCYVDGLKK
jgi:SAM-dependent methyltransferase